MRVIGPIQSGSEGLKEQQASGAMPNQNPGGTTGQASGITGGEQGQRSVPVVTGQSAATVIRTAQSEQGPKSGPTGTGTSSGAKVTTTATRTDVKSGENFAHNNLGKGSAKRTVSRQIE